VDSGTILATTPMHSAGIVDVVVKDLNSGKESTLVQSYEYVATSTKEGEDSNHWQGNISKHRKGTNDSLTLIITEQECSEVDNVTIDGNILTLGIDYTVSCIDDETHITLNPDYLNNLDPDTNYDIVVSFENGDTIHDMFEITNVGVPNTALSAIAETVIRIGGILIVALLVVGSVVIVIKRRARAQ